jgi:NAD(P)-dependent dehydrogenase (short-subunit alcohol dehydrogenase family)
MKNLRDRVVLITGAGSGIGRETAAAFAREGSKLILCDVNQQGLEEVCRQLGNAVLLHAVADVSKREEMAAFAATVHSQVEAVDVLVNNAGVGLQGGILDTTEEDFEWVLGVNLWGVIHGTRLFVPPMLQRNKGGHVVNLSSLAGYCATPGMLGYATSKFAVFGFSEALQAELQPKGIGVSTICPGVVHTNIIRTTRFKGAALPSNANEVVDQFYKRRNYGPAKVAAAIVAAVKNNQPVVPVTPESWLVYLMKRISPTATRLLASRIEGSALPKGHKV